MHELEDQLRETPLQASQNDKEKYYYIPIRMAKIKNSDNSGCWEGCWETGSLTYHQWEGRMIQPLWKII